MCRAFLQTPKEFGQILLKTDTSGAKVYLKDVADIELGSESYAVKTLYNGQEAAGMGIMLASGANALQVRQAVQERLDELSQGFPAGLKIVVPYDTTPFVKLSIQQVVMTLLEAIVLVFWSCFCSCKTGVRPLFQHLLCLWLSWERVRYCFYLALPLTF